MPDRPDVPPPPPPNLPDGALLLVEDNETDVLFMRRAIDQTGVHLPMQVASDGLQAMDRIAGRGAFSDRTLHPKPRLMLLDLRMPRKSGLEVLEWMKKEGHQNPRVVVFTSSTESEDVRLAYKLGAIAYIVKPVSLGPLKEIVKGLATFLRDPQASIDGALGWHIRPLL